MPSALPPVEMALRNDPLGFAKRTLKNLENIERALSVGADVHVVTQLMLSLLGLVVFPWEKQSFERLAQWPLDTFVYRSAPGMKWNITCDTYPRRCNNYKELLYHVRNAVSHRHVVFSSNSRDINEVSINFSDEDPSRRERQWSADISAVDLREFCVELYTLMALD